MQYSLIKHDDQAIGFVESNESLGALPWFARNVRGYSMDHATTHEGYSVDVVEELDCHDVAPLLEAIAKRIGLQASFAFVPLSQSRHAAPDANGKVWRSLNWKVTLQTAGTPLVTDYGQGEAHAPAYGWSESRKRLAWADNAIAAECETGKVAIKAPGPDPWRLSNKLVPAPALGDVLHSLVMDASVLDSSGFEDWASEYGYDTDSRKAETTYRECLETALKLKRMLGGDVLNEMRLVSQFN